MPHLTMSQNFASVLLFVSTIILAGLSACTQNSVSSPPSTPTASFAMPAVTTPEQPNLSFQVKRQSGNCPASLGAWEILLPFEGGADHIVVADIRSAEITTSTERSVTYAVPLADDYTSCIGEATAPGFAAYRFELRSGQVFFHVDPAPNVVATIVSKQLASGRPYVFWRAEE